MSHWTELSLIALDTETTGISPFSDRIVEIGAVTVNVDGTVTDTYAAVLDPGVPVPDGAAEVHGITTARAQAEGIDPAVALQHVADVLADHHADHAGQAGIVAFNVRFDWPLLLVEAERHGIAMPATAALLDPMLIDGMLDRYRKGSRKLIDVAAHYGVELNADEAHGALADATAAARVMLALVERYPELRARSLASMWLWQVQGHEVRRSGLEEYLRRKNPATNIPTGWPLPVAEERAS